MADKPNRKSSRSFDLSKPQHRRFDLSKDNNTPAPPPQSDSNNSSNGGSKKWIWAVLGGLVLVGGIVYFATRSSKTTNVDTDKATVAEATVAPTVSETTPTEQPTVEAPPSDQPVADPTPTESVVDQQPEQQPTASPTVSQPEKQPAAKVKPKQSTQNVSVATDEIEIEAQNVWKGKYGNGKERMQKLGDRYREIQDAVNRKYYHK